jgi:hypothetical protein
MDAETTAPKQQIGIPFKPGQSGNPAGRPKGSRNKLGEAFLEALHDDFAANGVAAIQQARLESPIQYVKVIASLLPSEHKITFTEQYEAMTDAELADRARQLAAAMAPLLADGVGATEAGTSGTGSAEITPRVH